MEDREGEGMVEKAMEDVDERKTRDEERKGEKQRRKERNSELRTKRYTEAERREGRN